MNVTIRKADERDFPFIFALIKEFSLFQKTPEKVTFTLKQLIAERDIFQCLVAGTDDTEIIGFASFFFTCYSWTGKGLNLDDLYVREGFRNQSVGKKLVDAVIEFAKGEGCKKIRWPVSGWNTNAIQFNKNIGALVDSTDLICDLSLQ